MLFWWCVLCFGGEHRLVGQAAGAPSPDLQVEGRLLDDAGQPVAGLLLAEPVDARFAPVRARISAEGRFSLLGLPPGEYRLRLVSLPFGIPIAGGELNAEQMAESTLELRFLRGSGEIRELRPPEPQVQNGTGLGVPVAAGAPPEPAGDWERAAELVPGFNDATTSATQDTANLAQETGDLTQARRPDAASGLSQAGFDPLWTTSSVDGQSTGQGYRGGPSGASLDGPRSQTSFSGHAIASLRASSALGSVAGYSASRGGFGVGLVVRSQRASDRVHGSGFARTQTTALAAVNPFAIATSYSNGEVTTGLVKPTDTLLLFGGTAGIPLPAFSLGLLGRVAPGLFVSEDAQKRTQDLVSTPVAEDFYQLSATQRALLANRGVSTAQTESALNYMSGLGGAFSVNAPRSLTFARLDLERAHGDRFEFAWNRQRHTTPSGPGLGSRAEGIFNRGRGSLGNATIHVDAVTARWSRPVGRGALFEMNFGFTHDLEQELPSAPLPQEPAIGPDGLAPQVLISPDGFGYGTPSTLGGQADPDETRLDGAGMLTMHLGSRHRVTLGGGWSRFDDRIVSQTNLAGSFSYPDETTAGHAGGLVDWITDEVYNVHAYPNGGCPSIYAATHYFCFHSFRQSFSQQGSEFFMHDSAGFGEDAVRLRDDLLLTFGVRYEYSFLPLPVAPNTTLDNTLRLLHLDTATATGANGGLTSVFPEDRNNFAPRLGIAWAPGTKKGRPWLSAHLGYGAFYGRVPGATIQAAFTRTAAAGATQTLRIVPTTETLCPQVANQGFGFPCSFLSEPTGVVAQTTSSVVFSSRFRLPAVQRASLELEHGFGRYFALRAAYMVSIATQLPNSVDLNIAPSTSTVSYVIQGGAGQPGLRNGETFTVPLYTARLSTNYGPITAITSHANATAQLGTMEAELRRWHGWSARAAYTYMEAIDTNPHLGPNPSRDTQFDPFAIGYDKGLSSLDFPHRVAGSVGFKSGGTGRRVVRHLSSGWEIVSTGVAGSGAPYSYNIYGGTYLSGGGDSINGSGGARWLPTVGRNTLRLPMRGRMDLRLARELPIFRALRARVEASAFNVLNTQAISRVETEAFLLGTAATGSNLIPLIFQDAATVSSEGLTTPAFGTPLSSTTGLSRERRVELGVHVSF